MEEICSHELKGLFQNFPRLKSKLSSHEIRGILAFVNVRVETVHGELLHRLTRLEMLQVADQEKYSSTLERLQVEAVEEKSLAEEYKSQFTNISRVLNGKSRRHENELDDFSSKVNKLEEDLVLCRRSKEAVQRDNDKKDGLVNSLIKEIDFLKSSLKEKSDYEKLVEDCQRLRKDLLRSKTDLDIQKRENAKLIRDITRLQDQLSIQSGVTPHRSAPFKELHTLNLNEASGVSDLDPGKEASKSTLTYKTVPTGKALISVASLPGTCSAQGCQARKHLEDCRSLLAKKCRENAQLSFLVAQTQGRAMCLDSSATRRAGLDCYTPRRRTRPELAPIHGVSLAGLSSNEAGSEAKAATQQQARISFK